MLMLAACALASPLHTWAQASKKVWRIGFLAIGSRPPSIESDALGGFARGMGELGYVEGRDCQIAWRFTEGQREAFFSAAAELAQSKVDFMVAASGIGVAATRKATSSKHPELLRIAMPGLSSVAVWLNPPSPATFLYVRQIQASAVTLGMTARQFGTQSVATPHWNVCGPGMRRERITLPLVRVMPAIFCRRAEPPEPGIWPSFCSGRAYSAVSVTRRKSQAGETSKPTPTAG